jgi:hypothetical protein
MTASIRKICGNGRRRATHEKIYELAFPGKREIGADGRCKAAAGNTVNLEEASHTNAASATSMHAHWTDTG